ncbi:MAG: hypothetical protein ACP5N7_05865 [Candidatus Pacearchaeota archaeon]
MKKIKLYWLRRGKEGFLVSNLWANKENAQMVANGYNYRENGRHTGKKHYKVIPCELIIKMK